MKYTNRKWQNHFRAKGFLPFMYDRLLAYSLGMNRQFKGSPFDFTKDYKNNPLAEYFFESAEEFPYVIYIEFTNKCNLNCLFCARKNMKRQLGFMTMALYKKIIDEIASEMPFSFVHLYGIGESTIDPTVLEKIEYAIKKGVTNLVLFTNGKNLLENDLYKKLVDTNIGTIGIDFDGFSKESYEKLRVGANFDNLIKAVDLIYSYVREKGTNTRIELAYQIFEGINDKEARAFVKWADKKKYEYKFVPMHQWAGLRNDIKATFKKKVRNAPCCALWTGMLLLWNGDVATCFLDADCKKKMGNINDNSIKEIWQGQMKAKRKNHVKGKFDGICANCREFLYNTPPKINSGLYPSELRK